MTMPWLVFEMKRTMLNGRQHTTMAATSNTMFLSSV